MFGSKTDANMNVWISKMIASHVNQHMVTLKSSFIFAFLESWIWLQWCRDLREFCWRWARLFQFTEVTEALEANTHYMLKTHTEASHAVQWPLQTSSDMNSHCDFIGAVTLPTSAFWSSCKTDCWGLGWEFAGLAPHDPFFLFLNNEKHSKS